MRGVAFVPPAAGRPFEVSRMNRRNRTTSAALGVVLLACSALGLAIRHDVPEDEYVRFGASFEAVGFVSGIASGTLIAPDWVLTAAHVVEMFQKLNPGKSLQVVFGETAHAVREVFVPEERVAEENRHDIALLLLEDPVADVTPLELYTGTEEEGANVVLAGYGILARGDIGVELSPQLMMSPTRRLRAGRNRIERVDEPTRRLTARFDDGEQADALEASPCVGDSGGPALIEASTGKEVPEVQEVQWLVAGVIAAVEDVDEDRRLGEYGEEFDLTRVSAYQDWIYETMEQ